MWLEEGDLEEVEWIVRLWDCIQRKRDFLGILNFIINFSDREIEIRKLNKFAKDHKTSTFGFDFFQKVGVFFFIDGMFISIK